MRLFVCCFLLCCLFYASVCTLTFAQDITQWRQIIDKNAPKTLPDNLGSKRPDTDTADACKTVVETADKMLADADLTEKDRRWALQRKAASLIILSYADTAAYYPRLAAVSDELHKNGIKNLSKETEKHLLLIGKTFVLTEKQDENNRSLKALAERMVSYAEQYPGTESDILIENFLTNIRQLNLAARDARLAVAAPVFHQYFQKINRFAKVQTLESDIRRSTLVGKPMYLAGTDLNGTPLNADSLANKVILVQFWGTWCRPCKEEIPALIKLYEKYHASGFEIVGINTGIGGDTVKKVDDFVKTTAFGGKKIPWIILHEGQEQKNPVSQFYGIKELPVLILIGRDGKVLHLHPPVGTLDAAVAAALAPGT
ncbi:MAG: TlpA family protein disulfide reductase [Planctomycetaceae bacterium]|jgi:thiol-disulfide isomerase/thioredoxin|nr:TlpA family protein disulfide reductase [Planctomycetaceae bacterium]